jgi:hypothetical protein
MKKEPELPWKYPSPTLRYVPRGDHYPICTETDWEILIAKNSGVVVRCKNCGFTKCIQPGASFSS